MPFLLAAVQKMCIFVPDCDQKCTTRQRTVRDSRDAAARLNPSPSPKLGILGGERVKNALNNNSETVYTYAEEQSFSLD